MSDYRKLWIEHHGPIPLDKNGKSFEIHHINGDHSDDRIENLMCVSIEDHYKIHESQGDLLACCAILRRMDDWAERFAGLSPEQKLKISEQAKNAAEERVLKGTHNFLGGEIQRAHQARRKQEGSHNFVGKKNPNYQVMDDGTIEVIINCLNKEGQNVRIPKSQYSSQQGEMKDWEYVTRNSKEGLRRLKGKHNVQT